MATLRLPLGIRLLLRSRSWWLCLAVSVAIEASLPFWGFPTFVTRHGNYFAEIPLAVPAQFLVVALVLYSTGSNFQLFERLAGRNIRRYNVGLVFAAILVLGAVAAVASAMIGNAGTVGWQAPLVTFIGMCGIGLSALTVMDRRIASLPTLLPIVGPVSFNPILLPGHEIWAFISNGLVGPQPVTFPVVWLVTGIILYGIAGSTSRRDTR